MSAHSESAVSTAPCACTNISLMQLFHELKQKFPGVPDHVVSNTIELYCHDKHACETHLHSEAKASLTHAYHASSSAAARQLNELKVHAPLKCPNQPITKHEIQNTNVITTVSCQTPQTATISLSTNEPDNNDPKPQPNTDANQNVLETKNDDALIEQNNNNISSPTINIDNCVVKYNRESPSDLELTNEEVPEETTESTDNHPDDTKDVDQPESINYKILKSSKVKSNLNEKFETAKEKKTIKKEEQDDKEVPTQNVEKPKRPNTLEFIKLKPDIAFKETLPEPKAETCKSISPTPSAQKQDTTKETTPGGSHWPGAYPLNLSVNVNCHMDYGRGFDPWLEDYDSPRAITSVNLTVCTPTSNMASPVREGRDDDGGFEGHVTVTVSPSTARAPRRRAPQPPQQVSQPVESQRSARSTVESSQERTLIERQRERLGRLKGALLQEQGRVSQLTRETQILAGPPPSILAARRLRDYVHRLRDQCDTLAKRLEMGGNEPDAADFYSNIYTGQRAPAARRPTRPAPPPPPDEAPSWQCHVCTFRNHGLLDKCEECEMPRILVGTSPRTLDSGFGSFRDRSRRPSQIDGETHLFGADVPDRPANRACV